MRNLSIYLSLFLSAFVLTVPASADDETLETRPGYVDFSTLAAEYGEPRVMVDLSESLLQLISAMKHDDPVAEEALRSIESVRIHVYDTEGKIKPATERMDSARATLNSQEWEQIVRVREPDEQVEIFVKHDEGRIYGLTVMAVEEHEAVFINVLGDIDPAQLNAVVDNIDIGVDLDMDLAMESHAP